MSSETVSNTIGSGKRDPKAYPLDPSRYSLEGPALQFWKEQTGVHDEEQLKKHILVVQAEAYSVFAYQCISHFVFTRPRIADVPGYDQLLRLGKERDGAIFLDVGCCFGTDTRKVVADGWPRSRIVASDIHPEFWELGHKLFRSTKEDFPVTFVPGNLVDPVHLEVAPVLSAPPDSPPPALDTLTSLNPLRGHVSAIHAGALFHLFTEEQQTQLARALAGLLSPLPGSMIVGSNGGAREKGLHVVLRGDDSTTVSQFRHTADSWKALWEGEVFEKGTVEVEVSSMKLDTTPYDDSTRILERLVLKWSVTRL